MSDQEIESSSDEDSTSGLHSEDHKTPKWVDSLYEELDGLSEECITEEDANPLEVAQVVHDYAEQLKIEILSAQRNANREQ